VLRAVTLLALALAAVACSRQGGEGPGTDHANGELPEPAAPPPAQSPVAPYHDWTLAEYGDRADVPDGKTGEALTLLFDAATGRVSGFAGCNRFTGSYTLEGTHLKFGELATTKMACARGMELEAAYLASLGAANRFRLTGAELQILGTGATVATEMRFRPLESPKP